jgi:hypothetical protein
LATPHVASTSTSKSSSHHPQCGILGPPLCLCSLPSTHHLSACIKHVCTAAMLPSQLCMLHAD